MKTENINELLNFTSGSLGPELVSVELGRLVAGPRPRLQLEHLGVLGQGGVGDAHTQEGGSEHYTLYYIYDTFL